MDRARRLEHLLAFLRTIQRPDRPLDGVGEDESLVASGLIDSLALLQIVAYLEETYGIDFSARGVEPEELRSMRSILDLIERDAR
ncbi:MAG TPA: acyl carrier protein [Candidatus Binatia bacterium]|jgi:acyl carrier protein|nr:acyl carrier protein [Candidatus Binatia bacterium]